jgi:hypothetical protein
MVVKVVLRKYNNQRAYFPSFLSNSFYKLYEYDSVGENPIWRKASLPLSLSSA